MGSSKEDAAAAFKQADALFRGEQYAGALEILVRLNDMFPHERNILLPMAMCLEKTGSLVRAEQVVDELIGRFNDPRALGMKSVMIQRRGRASLPGASRRVVAGAGSEEGMTVTAISAGALVAANLVLLVGAAHFGWRVYVILLAYWVEHAVLGLLNVLKLAMVLDETRPGILARLPAIFSYATFYSIMLAIMLFGLGMYFNLTPHQGLDGRPYASGDPDVVQISDLLFGSLVENGEERCVVLAALAVLAGNSVSFFVTFVWSGAYRRVTWDEVVRRPGGLLPRAIIFALPVGMGFSIILSPYHAAVILVLLKAALDLATHLAHRRTYGV